PVDGPVGRPRPLMRLETREAQDERAGLTGPAVAQRATLRLLDREAAKDPEAIGVLACRIDGQRIRVGIPRAHGMNDSRVHAGLPHLVQQLVPGEGGDLPVARVRRLAGRPEMHLSVDYAHGSLAPSLSR